MAFSKNVLCQKGIMNQGELVSKDVYHKISFNNTTDEIIAYTSLKGNFYKCIFDTGAPFSISKEVQEKLKYPVIQKVPVSDAENNTDTIFIVRIDTIKIGKLIFKDIPSLVLDFKNSPLGCMKIDGIVGSNLTRFLIVQFNLAKNEIILTDELDRVKIENPHKKLAITLDNQSNAFFEVDLNNSIKDTVHFDSGMGKMYDINVDKIKQMQSASKKSPLNIFKGYGMSGQGLLGTAKPEETFLLYTNFSIGYNLIEKAQINSTQAKSRIGRELLNYGTFTLDYKNKWILLDKYTNKFHKPKPNFGIELISENNKVIIGVTWENIQKNNPDLTSGVEITSLNGESFKGKTTCQCDEVISKAYQLKKWKITYLHNGKVKKCVLKSILN
jgi:hypothetical protein